MTHLVLFPQQLFWSQSLSVKKQKIPFATSMVGQRVLLGTEIVPILSLVPLLDWVRQIVLVLQQNRELQFLLTKHQWQNCCHMHFKVVILFPFENSEFITLICIKVRTVCSAVKFSSQDNKVDKFMFTILGTTMDKFLSSIILQQVKCTHSVSKAKMRGIHSSPLTYQNSCAMVAKNI